MDERYTFMEGEVRLKLCEGRTLYSPIPLNTPDAAVQTMSSLLGELDHEVACIVNVDARLRPINFSVVGVGNQTSCMVSTSNIFKSALLSGASSILLLHNHPSGELSPSSEDLLLTQRLIEAGHLLELPLMDHIIIGGGTGNWYSIRQENPEIDFRQAPVALREKSEVLYKKIRKSR